MFDVDIPPSSPPGPVGCRGAAIVLLVTWVLLGAAALVIWSIMCDVG